MARKLSREFCVVQFLKLPFEGIDDYVYVPNNWLIRRTNKKAVVSYPNDEDPSDTRNRVKLKERYNDKWKLYLAAIKYETDTYWDAEFWIAARKFYGPSIEEESGKDTTLNVTPWKSLPKISIKRLTSSKTKNQLDKKRVKLGEAAQSPSTVVNDTNVEPNCSNKEQWIIIKDKQPMDYAQTEETAAASNGEDSTAPRTQSPYIEQNGQALSLPVIDVDKPTKIIITDDEDHLQGVKQPDKNNRISQSHLSEDTTAASITATEPSTLGNQTSQPYQHNNREYVLDGDSSSSNLQIQMENVRSIAKRLINIARNSDITGNPSNLMDQVGSISTHSVKQPSVVTQNQSQDGQRVLETHTENIRNQTASLRINMEQTSTNSSNLLYETSELPQQRQSQPNQQDPQQQPQRPKKCVINSTKPKNQRQMPTLQGLTKKTLPPVLSNNLNLIRQALSTSHNNDLLNEQQLQARWSTKSTEHNHSGLTTSPQNIAASATRDKQNSELPSCSFYQPPRIQRTTSQDNEYQNLRMQEQLVNQSTTTNSKLKRAHFEDDTTNSTVNESHLNVIKVGKRAHDVATVDSWNILQNVTNIASASQNLSSSSNQRPSFVLHKTSELLQQRQSQPNQQDSQQQPQIPKKRVKNFTKPKNKRQMPTLQGVTKETPPPVLLNVLNSIRQALSTSHNNYLLNEQQLLARRSTKSTEHNHTGLTTNPQNIAASATSDKQNSELPSCSFYQPPRIQDTTAHENVYQSLRKQEQLVNQSTITNSKLKRAHFEDDTTNSTVNESHLNVIKVGKRAHDVATVDSWNILQNVTNIASASQNLSSSSNQRPSFVLHKTSELLQQRQSQPNQQDSQQQPQIPKKRVKNSTKPKNKRQMPTLQGVTKETPPPVLLNYLNSIRQALSTSHNNYLLNEQQLLARQSTKSTEHNHTGLTTNPQNIAASATSDKQNSELPSCSFYQPPRIQDTTAHENVYQSLRKQEQLVNQSTITNSKLKQAHFEDDTTNSAVNDSHLNVMAKACLMEECMVEKTQSPYHAVNSDSDTGTDHEVISDHDMCTDASQVKTTNNVYCTETAFGSSSPDRPTIAPTTPNDHTYPRVVLEQQMLDSFATLLTQIGSTLHYMCDMYNSSRSSIVDIAETYKKLLDAVERFNSVVNSASNPSR